MAFSRGMRPLVEAVMEANKKVAKPGGGKTEFAARRKAEQPKFRANSIARIRKEIEQWLETHDTSPLTNQRLDHQMLTTSLTVKQQIEKLVESGELEGDVCIIVLGLFATKHSIHLLILEPDHADADVVLAWN